MRKIHWRVYSIIERGDMERATARYKMATGEKPMLVMISERAPEEVMEWACHTGMEVVRGKGMLPRDVWMTHEAEALERINNQACSVPKVIE